VNPFSSRLRHWYKTLSNRAGVNTSSYRPVPAPPACPPHAARAGAPGCGVSTACLKSKRGFNTLLKIQKGLQYGPYNSPGISTGSLKLTMGFRRVAEQGYLAHQDHGAGSSCRSLNVLTLMFPPKGPLNFKRALETHRRGPLPTSRAPSSARPQPARQRLSHARSRQLWRHETSAARRRPRANTPATRKPVRRMSASAATGFDSKATWFGMNETSQHLCFQFNKRSYK
jgi:hypothetical protein